MTDTPAPADDAVERAKALPPPTVREIIVALDDPTDKIARCTDNTGKVRQPPELWIASVGTWLLMDGSRAMIALKGTHRFNGLDRMRLASACKRWARRNP